MPSRRTWEQHRLCHRLRRYYRIIPVSKPKLVHLWNDPVETLEILEITQGILTEKKITLLVKCTFRGYHLFFSGILCVPSNTINSITFFAINFKELFQLSRDHRSSLNYHPTRTQLRPAPGSVRVASAPSSPPSRASRPRTSCDCPGTI